MPILVIVSRSVSAPRPIQSGRNCAGSPLCAAFDMMRTSNAAMPPTVKATASNSAFEIASRKVGPGLGATADKATNISGRNDKTTPKVQIIKRISIVLSVESG
jgi:hypothetical protein